MRLLSTWLYDLSSLLVKAPAFATSLGKARR